LNTYFHGRSPAVQPDRQALTATASSRPIREAAEGLTAQLRIPTGPETSISIGGSAAVAIVRLATIETELVTFRKWLSELAVGTAEEEKPAKADPSPSPTVEELRKAYARIPDPPFLTFTHLTTLLILVNRQLVRGAP